MIRLSSRDRKSFGPLGPVAHSAFQQRLFFEQIDFHFHRQLTDLALEFNDLALIFGDPYRLRELIGELARLVFAALKPHQIARRTVAPRDFVQAGTALEKLLGELALELQTEAAIPSHGLSSDRPSARSNSSLPTRPVLGVGW
jgi:hypothetical protein